MNREDRLLEDVKRRYQKFKVVRFDLSVLQVDTKFSIAGDFLYVEKMSSTTAAASLRFARDREDTIDLKSGRWIRGIFHEIYLSNVAQAGEWIELAIGVEVEIGDNDVGAAIGQAQAAILITHANADTNQAGGANACNKVLIKADVQNTGISWIDIGQAAVQDSCMPLDPGDWIELDIANTNLINCNFEIGGELVHVIFTV